MLEPLLMLTVLNCFFMFSSTVTTCALWWQYRRHREHCPTHEDTASKLKVKRTTFNENKKSKVDGKHSGPKNAECAAGKLLREKSEKKDSRVAKDRVREKKIVIPGTTINATLAKTLTERKDEDHKILEKMASTEDTRHGAGSPSSDAKSTIVMEVSTVQKVVQILDCDRDHQYLRIPKETITCRFSPDAERKIELIADGKTIERK